ncbi:MAG: DUF6789 family protein [Calditrichota bacterium]
MALAEFTSLTLTGGVIATICMTIYTTIIHRLGLANTDMVRAVGGFYSRSYENALGIGLIVHFIAGILFSAVYVIVLNNVLSLQGFGTFVIASTIIGFIHGFVFSFGMIILSEHHPLERFRDLNSSVIFFHLVGHVIYGAVIGMTLGFLIGSS